MVEFKGLLFTSEFMPFDALRSIGLIFKHYNKFIHLNERWKIAFFCVNVAALLFMVMIDEFRKII